MYHPKTMRHALYKSCLKLPVYVFALQHLLCLRFVALGRYIVHKLVINHANMRLCVWQGMLQKAVYECRQDQRDRERHTSPHVERCEVNEVLCNNGGIFLPHLCCQNSQDLTASLSFPPLMHPICTSPYSKDTT